MDARDAARLLERGEATALDVREAAEWDAGRIPGALHIPMGDLAVRQDELPRETRLVAVCRSGNRSGLVAQALRSAGYAAENLDGGLLAWARAGLPLEPPDARVA